MSTKLVLEVAMQGCTEYEEQWVSSFKVQYTVDDENWTWVGSQNRWKEFKGRHHGAGVLRQPVNIPFQATKVRFYPIKCEAQYGVTPACAMRFEVYFADVPTAF